MSETNGEIVPASTEPYTHLLLSMRNQPTMSYIFKVPEQDMDEIIKGWEAARADGGLFTIDAGAEGLFHLASEDITMVRRITDGMLQAMHEAQKQASLALATSRFRP